MTYITDAKFMQPGLNSGGSNYLSAQLEKIVNITGQHFSEIKKYSQEAGQSFDHAWHNLRKTALDYTPSQIGNNIANIFNSYINHIQTQGKVKIATSLCSLLFAGTALFTQYVTPVQGAALPNTNATLYSQSTSSYGPEITHNATQDNSGKSRHNSHTKRSKKKNKEPSPYELIVESGDAIDFSSMALKLSKDGCFQTWPIAQNELQTALEAKFGTGVLNNFGQMIYSIIPDEGRSTAYFGNCKVSLKDLEKIANPMPIGERIIYGTLIGLGLLVFGIFSTRSSSGSTTVISTTKAADSAQSTSHEPDVSNQRWGRNSKRWRDRNANLKALVDGGGKDYYDSLLATNKLERSFAKQIYSSSYRTEEIERANNKRDAIIENHHNAIKQTSEEMDAIENETPEEGQRAEDLYRTGNIIDPMDDY